MVFVIIGVLIFAVGGLAYTLDINVFVAFFILVGLAVLCGLIGYGISKIITKDSKKTLRRATTFNRMTIPSIILGVVLWIVGYSKVHDSTKIVATSQIHLLFKTVVTPSFLTLIGTFAIILGITFWVVASPHLPQKPQDKK